MRIAIVAAGSRGDAEPFLALALALRRRGHQPVYMGHEEFRGRARELGIEFRAMPGDPRQMIATGAGLELMSERSPVAILTTLRMLGDDLFDETAEALERELPSCDAVVFSTLAVAAYHVADKYGMPRIWAVLQPVTATRMWPSLLLPDTVVPVPNLLTHRIADQLTWSVFGPPTMRYRKRAGLTHVSSRRLRTAIARELPVLGGWSPTLAPRPSDWPSHVEVTGAWRLATEPNADTGLGAQVQEFLDAGDPPVYLGLGSATVADPERVTTMFVEAARLAGVRLILSSGWAGLGRGDAAEAAQGEDVLVVGDTVHSELFPRCAAVGHHCGAGTTHAAFHSGAVSIPLPMWGDQPFWAQRLHHVGAAVAPIAQRRWSVGALAQGIAEAVREPWRQQRSHALGRLTAGEAGADRAGIAVERILMAVSAP